MVTPECLRATESVTALFSPILGVLFEHDEMPKTLNNNNNNLGS